ncbi:formate/nitrite transporter family protein [Actinomyces sp. W5033]|uniref:formate/nitrite transporter family protein n=1 Tax=Actinomyces sp. W5033 TaxID=3446479 RepID=UPI003EDEE5F8
MLSLTQNIDYHAGYAVTRTGEARRPLPFLVSSMLGGAFIGLADVFMFTAAGPFRQAGDPWFPLVSGAVFGMGLILCVFAGGELATSAMMVFTVGAVRRTISWARAGGVLMLIGRCPDAHAAGQPAGGRRAVAAGALGGRRRARDGCGRLR